MGRNRLRHQAEDSNQWLNSQLSDGNEQSSLWVNTGPISCHTFINHPRNARVHPRQSGHNTNAGGGKGLDLPGDAEGMGFLRLATKRQRGNLIVAFSYRKDVMEPFSARQTVQQGVRATCPGFGP